METSHVTFNGNKTFLYLLLTILPATLCAQFIDINPNFTNPETYFKFENIWNIDLYKPSTNNQYYFATAQIYNNHRQLLAKSKTKSFQILTTTFNILTRTDVTGPFETEWINPDFFQHIQKTGGFLPAGNYSIEFTLLATTPGCNWAGEVILKKNFPLQIDFFNQLELVYPPDNDTLYTMFPNFLWLPITPFYNNIQYTLKLTECNQNPLQDIFLNPPYLQIQNLNTNQITYPGSARKLEQGKRYVWQVIATNDKQQILAVSAPYAFYVADVTKKKNLTLNPLFSYIELTEDINNQWISVHSDTLFFSLYERDNPAQNDYIEIHVTTTDAMNKEKKENETLSLPYSKIGNGMNFYYALLNNLKNGTYQIQVKNKKKKKTLTFYIRINKGSKK